jgi:hypothetical protein
MHLAAQRKRAMMTTNMRRNQEVKRKAMIKATLRKLSNSRSLINPLLSNVKNR